MTGKAALLLILGFSTIFLIVGNNFAGLSNRGVDNMVNYYTGTVSHDLAVSGANLAASKIFFDSDWDAGFSDLKMFGGTITVNIIDVDKYKGIKKIVSKSEFNGDSSMVSVTLQPSKFSKFAYYSVSEGAGDIWWTGNDTVWGPFHTQDELLASKHPTFMGKASSKRGLRYYDDKKTDKPNFNGGYQEGVDLPLPKNGVSSIAQAAADGGYVFNKDDYGKEDAVYLTFEGDKIKFKFSSSKKAKETEVSAADFAPNGVIFVPEATLYIKGVVSGQYTIGVSAGKKSGGSIILEDDIVYSKDPRKYSGSTDMLGIVAENDVIIEKNSDNNNDINIDASIYCENGGFTAEDWDDRPESGAINLFGGLIQNIRGAVGTFNSKKGDIETGFAKKYKYDERLMVASPPAFPGTGGFEIVSWYE